MNELGHIWYADKTMGDFVAQAEKQLPDSLFIITGDHMERFTFAVEQDARVMMSVPCIFYGQGVQKDWFKENAVGRLPYAACRNVGRAACTSRLYV